MAYNKAKAEREWLRWKESEESQLRQLGVDEDTIQRLHTYDWQSFCVERRFCEWQEPDSNYIEEHEYTLDESPEQNIDDFLNAIETETLYNVLCVTDALTLQMVLLKVKGFSVPDICKKLGVTKRAFYCRWDRFKQKIKNIF